MRWNKLIVLISLLVLLFFTGSSCRQTDFVGLSTSYLKRDIPMSGAQETPATPSSAQGTMDVSYSKTTKVLSYKITWQNLADTITGIHIHGLAPAGYPAGIVQNILTTKNETAFPHSAGTYSGSLLVDDILIKEENLLNGLYYLNIHTKTYPGGEIRGQIRFN